jgi:hypothetical protein
MKEVQITKGMSATVDDEDFEKVSKFKWYAHESKPGQFYARKYLGTFETAELAAKAFDKAAKEMYGEFCGKLNYE